VDKITKNNFPLFVDNWKKVSIFAVPSEKKSEDKQKSSLIYWGALIGSKKWMIHTQIILI